MDQGGPWNPPGQKTEVGSLFLLQRDLPDQQSNRISCTAGGFLLAEFTEDLHFVFHGDLFQASDLLKLTDIYPKLLVWSFVTGTHESNTDLCSTRYPSELN